MIMSMESIRIENMYDLNETIAAEIFEGKTYPWEVLPLIKEFIVKLGNTLDPAEYSSGIALQGRNRLYWK